MSSSSSSEEENDSSRSSAIVVVEVPNVSKFEGKVYSKLVFVRFFPFRVCVAPRMQEGVITSLSVYVECLPKTSNQWQCKVKGKFTLKSHNDNTADLWHSISQPINETTNDWGFPHFVDWEKIIEPNSSFCKDDTITIVTEISVESFSGLEWDSKALSGYVGMKNQGATCYMNSLLQTLFFINKLRIAVYQLPVDYSDCNQDTGLALQQLFYDLQHSKKSVETKELTQSFGWRPSDALVQHDVQELCRVLLTNIEMRMKGTSVDGLIADLFQGMMISKITCKNIKYESARKELFYDIQLPLKGKKDIIESFREYCAAEVLDGNNQYSAGEHGKQDAERRDVFERLPPVLHLHLMRFEYNAELDCNTKLSDKYEFFEKIDLTEFLEKPEETPTTYTLQSVLVHSEGGSANFGHYVAFINPKCDGNWVKFDDEVVYKCSKEDAISGNFGGRFFDATAYMLVYIKDSCIVEVLQPVQDEDIPDELRERIRQKRRTKEPMTDKQLEYSIFLEEHLYLHHGINLIDLTTCKFRNFRAQKLDTMLDVTIQIASQLGFPINCIKLWKIVGTGRRFRPADFSQHDLSKTTERYFHENHKIFFVETTEPDNDQVYLQRPSPDYILLFYKLFDPIEKTLNYVGRRYVLKTANVRQVLETMDPDISQLASDAVLVFREFLLNDHLIVTNLATPDHPDKPFDGAIDDGHIIIYQKNLTVTTEDGQIFTVINHFQDLFNRVEMTLCDRTNLDSSILCEFDLRWVCETVVEKIACHLGTTPERIQLHGMFSNHNCWSIEPIPSIASETLQQLLNVYPRLLYEVLPELSLNTRANERRFEVTFMPYGLTAARELRLFVDQDGTVGDLLAAAHIQLMSEDFNEEYGSGILRFISIDIYRYLHQHMDTEPLRNFKDSGCERVYRIEEIPKDELDCTVDQDASILVPCSHFEDTMETLFGCSFLIRVYHNELVATLGERIRARLRISEKEFSHWKVAIVNKGKIVTYDPSDTLDLRIFEMSSKPYLALLHVARVKEAELRIL